MTQQPTSFIDCRGLSAPLTVLRIKQAVVGRSDCGLPLDVLVDGDFTDSDRVTACLTGESTDIRLLYSSPDLREFALVAAASAKGSEQSATHV